MKTFTREKPKSSPSESLKQGSEPSKEGEKFLIFFFLMLRHFKQSERTIYNQGGISSCFQYLISKLFYPQKWFLFVTQTFALNHSFCIHSEEKHFFITQIYVPDQWEWSAHRRRRLDHQSLSPHDRGWTWGFGGMSMRLVHSDSLDDCYVSIPAWAFDCRPDQDV